MHSEFLKILFIYLIFFLICHIFFKSNIPKRLHGINAPVCIIYGVIGMHAGCQLLCIDWIRSKISLSDQGRDRERLKDLRLHLPMNIWCLSEGERQWSSVRSSRCHRKSTLSASGHISTVSYVNAPPRPPHAEESCSSHVNGKCSFHLQSMPACFFFSFFSASKTKHNNWFMLPSGGKRCSILFVCQTDTGQLFGWDLASLKPSQHNLMLLPVSK